MIGEAKTFLRIVFEDTLDLIVTHAELGINIAVASMERVLARAIDGCALTRELSVRQVLNRSCTKLRPEGATKLLR